MIKAIIFDMDGTILDSDHLVLLIYRELTAMFPPRFPLADVAKRDLLAKSYREMLDIMYGYNQEALLEEIGKIHAKHKKNALRLFPHTAEILISLKQKGYLLGLVTSELRSIALDELHLMEIAALFDKIVTVDDVVRPKPAPDGIRVLLDEWHLDPTAVLFVGDQPSDALAGHSAFVQTVGMSWDHHRKVEMTDYFDLVFANWNDLTMYLNQTETGLSFVLPADRQFRILQLTDLHYMDETTDTLTDALIQDIVLSQQPDLLVLTGDQTMSPKSAMLYERMSKMLDSLETPWTFVFGNHDAEGSNHQSLITAVQGSKCLTFEPGDAALGYSDFRIDLVDQRGKTRWHLFFLDTHSDETYQIDHMPVWGYSSVNPNQIRWYEDSLRNSYRQNGSIVPSLVFLHIPPYEVQSIHREEGSIYLGEYNERPSTPPLDRGFVTAAIHLKSTKAIFAGHDHLNDFTFEYNGLLLAYGRISGHYEYGMPGFPKGARLIEIDQTGELKTKVILHQDCIKKT